MNLSDDIGIGRKGGEATVDLTGRPDLRDVRAAIVHELVLTAHPDDRFGAVLLVLDELVGNAYRHSTAPRLLRAGRTSTTVLIEVSDRDPVPGAVRTRATGFGLRLIGQLSLDWGVRTDAHGKTVWALVPLHLSPAGLDQW